MQQNGGIIADLPADPVEKTFIQPLGALWHPDMGDIFHVSGIRGGAGGGMDGSVVGTDVSGQQAVELINAPDPGNIKGIQETGPQGSEIAFHLAFAGAVPDRSVYQDTSKLSADEVQLLAFIGGAVVHIEFAGDAVGSDGVPENFLEVDAAVLIKELSAGDEAGAVIQDHNAVSAP